MTAATLDGLFSQPNFLAVFVAVLFTIGNIIVGVSILPKDRRRKRYLLHRFVYGVVVVAYGVFLWFNRKISGNSLFDYFVLLYFLSIIPWSRKVNVTTHAILASIGLVLMTLAAILTI